MNKLVPVAFHGQTLHVATIDNTPVVALRPVCEALGIDTDAQLQRIKRHPVLSTCTVVITAQLPGDKQKREVTFLPLDKLNGWLFGIHASRAKPELREKLIQYQRECFDVLARHFGAASDARPYAVLPGQTLSAEQADELRRLMTDAAAKLPHAQQGAFLQRGWSKLRAHFGVPYREIPASQFSEAVSLIARHALESAPALPALPEARVLIPVADDFNLDEAKHHLIKAWSVSMLIGQEILACLHKRPEAKAFLVEIPAGNKNTPTVRALMPAQGDFS